MVFNEVTQTGQADFVLAQRVVPPGYHQSLRSAQWKQNHPGPRRHEGHSWWRCGRRCSAQSYDRNSYRSSTELRHTVRGMDGKMHGGQSLTVVSNGEHWTIYPLLQHL